MTELLRPIRRTAPVAAGTLRVGLVCPYSMSVPGGVQNHVLGLAGYLTSIGDRVRILAPGELDPARARHHGLRPDQFSSVGPAVPVPYNGSVARITLGPRVAARVRGWLAAEPLDLLHLHEPLAPSVSLLGLVAGTVPIAATFHTATPRSRLLRAAGAALQPMIDRIGAGIAVSESARQVVADHLGRHPQVIPNGIRSGEFDPDGPGRSARAGAGDRQRLVFLGRLDEPRKGLAVLLDALPMITERHPELEVVIAGRGGRPRLLRRLPPGCRTVGPVDDQERDALLRSADLFVAPHIARESFGIVLIEAMAAGASVIASDLPAFTDLLTAGVEPGPSTDPVAGGSALGFLFPTGDPVALAATVDRALSHDRRALAARARTAVARYDWSAVGPAVRTVYNSVIDGRGW